MAHPLCRIISVALIVQCFIATSTNAAVHTGHHPSGHKGPRYATTSSTMSVAMAENEVEAKASKPKPSHNGGGGKHDSGVDGQHPTTVVVSTSKAGKPAAPSPSSPADNSWHAPATHAPTSNSWEGHSTATDSKTAKASDATKKTKTKSSSMSLGAKTHKDAATSDSKADKGGDTKADKPAPNEYNGVKMVVKAPEGAMKEAKSGKVEGTDDGSWSSGSSVTTTTSTLPATTTQAASNDIPSVATLPAETTPPATTTEAVQRAPPAPEKKRDADEDEDEDAMPTYSPTSLIKERASVEETFSALEPFGLRFLSSKAQPIFDLDTVTTVTMEHLLHSFRTKGWDVNRLKLMLLDEEDEARIRGLRKLQGSFPVHELVFGGILYFKTTSEMPSEDEMTFITEESFTGDRLSYFVDLLQEKGMDVSSASWGHLATSSEPIQDGGKVNLVLILGATLGSVGLFFACLFSVRLFNKRQRRIEAASSRPNLVFRIKDEVDMVDLNGHHNEASTIPITIEDNATSSRYSYYTKQALTSEASDPVSPLETPSDTVSTNTRYVSVFTVKKDCGGKPLEQVDLRKLAVAYLSRLFKKVPHTILLPYDKDSDLPAITSIRTIPDDLQELLAYVGQPRIDEYTGKVLFNLRCESDIPMSKMKNLSGQKKQKKSTATSDDYSASSGFEDVTL